MSGADRGQTVIDYAVAAGIFLVAVTFVLGFIPGMFAPFSGPNNSLVADRIADTLGTDALGDPNTPYALDTTCTEAFFEQMQTGADAPATCRFDTGADGLREALAVDETTNVNVTVQNLDGTVFQSGGREYVAGDDIPRQTSVTTARRIVRLDGESVRLLVRVW